MPDENETIDRDDRLGFARAALLGLQHALAMDVYVVPALVASLVGLAPLDASLLIAAGFVASGIATLIQSQFCLRMPVVQGPSYVPIGAVSAIAHASGGGMAGLAAVYAALLPGAFLVALLGWPARVFHVVVERLVPKLVGGTIIVVVGITLMPLAISADILGNRDPAKIGGDILIALVSAGLSVLSSVIGAGRQGWRGAMRISSVIIALMGGSLLAGLMGRLDLGAVATARWLLLPRLTLLDFPPRFDPAAILTLLVIYAVVLAETTGTWFAVAAVTGRPLPSEKLDRGALGEGLGCGASALLGALPVTGYASNAGIITLTGVADRRAFLAAGLVLVGFGLCGKLAALIASVPAPVIGGVFGVLCVVIVTSGLRVLADIALDERSSMIVGLPILLGLFATLLPRGFLASLPPLLQYGLGAPTALAAAGAILLNLILPTKSSIK